MARRARPASHSYFSHRLRLHYLDWGNEDAPTLFLVHGIHDHCHSWDWIAERFSDRYHVVAPDLRGHGDSEWSIGSSYTYLEYVYDIAQLIQQRELAPANLIGHSLGGTIASIFAGINPDLVDKLVIVEGVGLYPEFLRQDPLQSIHMWLKSSRSLAGRTPRKYPTLEDAYQRMHQANQHLTESQARHLTLHGSNQNEDGTYSWKFDNYTRNRSPNDVTNDDLARVWQNIESPVMIINSTEGYPHRIGQDGSTTHFSKLTMVTVGDAGHWTHHDQLEEVIAHAEGFL